MPIFTNRILAKLLKELPNLPDSKAAELKARLSSAIDGDHRISAEWEIVVFSCLSKIGNLDFFEDVEGSRSVDVIFTSRDTGERVQIEITAISDNGLHSQNPINIFSKRLSKLSAKLQPKAHGALDFRIGHVKTGDKLVLGIPLEKDMDIFFSSAEMKEFLKRISANPEIEHRFEFAYRGSSSCLIFRPGKTTSSGGYIAHDVILDLQKNHIVNRLKKKANQIREGNVALPAIVILCDGNCRALHTDGFHGMHPSVDQIIHTFLNGRPHWQSGQFVLQKGINQSSSRINAVVVLAVKEKREVLFHSRNKYTEGKYYLATEEVQHKINPNLVEKVARSFIALPRPSTSPLNARREYRYPEKYGGGSIQGSNMAVRISLLALQGLLGGTISHAEFIRDHGMLSDQIMNAIKRGQMISKLEVEYCPDDDDDWVAIEFDRIAPKRLFAQ